MELPKGADTVAFKGALNLLEAAKMVISQKRVTFGELFRGNNSLRKEGDYDDFLNLYERSRKMNRKILMGLILIGTLLFFAYAEPALSKGKPPKKVDVVTDEYGNPRISAPTNKKMFQLLGHVVVQNELWGLEFVKRESLGTLAEILGPAYLSVDKSRRLTGFTEQELQSTFDSLGPEAQEILIVQ
jgi:hypothetical protein